MTEKHLNNFSLRTARSGWSEKERMEVVKAGVTGYEIMLKTEKDGGRPVNRPIHWDEDLRQKRKESKQKNWFRKGGFDAKRMQEKEAQNNQGRRIRLKMIEKRGITLENKLRRSNPWKGGKCGRSRCFPCRGKRGGDYVREGVWLP